MEISADDFACFKAKPCPFILQKSWHYPIFQLLFPGWIWTQPHKVNTGQIPTIVYGLNPEWDAASCVWEAMGMWFLLGEDSWEARVTLLHLRCEGVSLILRVSPLPRLLFPCSFCTIINAQRYQIFEILHLRAVQSISPCHAALCPGSYFCQALDKGPLVCPLVLEDSSQHFHWVIPVKFDLDCSDYKRSITQHKVHRRYTVHWCTVSWAIIF